MFEMLSPKLALLSLLLIGIGVFVFGGVQKLRDGEVGWKWSSVVSQRNGRDPLGYWISVSANFIFAAAAMWLVFEIALDRVPVTWGR